jgi:hypothetical protein
MCIFKGNDISIPKRYLQNACNPNSQEGQEYRSTISLGHHSETLPHKTMTRREEERKKEWRNGGKQGGREGEREREKERLHFHFHCTIHNSQDVESNKVSIET